MDIMTAAGLQPSAADLGPRVLAPPQAESVLDTGAAALGGLVLLRVPYIQPT